MQKRTTKLVPKPNWVSNTSHKIGFHLREGKNEVDEEAADVLS
jgi:hypothetical protein